MSKQENFDLTIEIPAHDDLPAESLGFMLLDRKEGGKEYKLSGTTNFAPQLITGTPSYNDVPRNQELLMVQDTWKHGFGQRRELLPASGRYLWTVEGDASLVAGSDAMWGHGLKFTACEEADSEDFRGVPVTFFTHYDVNHVAIGGCIYTINDTTHELTLAWEGGLQIDDCDLIWDSEQATAVLNTTIEKEGTGCCEITVGAGVGVDELLVSQDVASWNATQEGGVLLWVRSSITLDAGDMEFVVSTAADCATIIGTFEIPAIPVADTWYRVYINGEEGRWAFPDSSKDAIISIGVVQAVDVGAFTLYLDDIQMTAGAGGANSGDISDVTVYDVDETTQLACVSLGYRWTIRFWDTSIQMTPSVNEPYYDGEYDTEILAEYSASSGGMFWSVAYGLLTFTDEPDDPDAWQSGTILPGAVLNEPNCMALASDGGVIIGTDYALWKLDVVAGDWFRALVTQQAGAPITFELHRANGYSDENYFNSYSWNGHTYFKTESGAIFAWSPEYGTIDITPWWIAPDADSWLGKPKAFAGDYQWLYVIFEPVSGDTDAIVMKVRPSIIDGKFDYRWHGSIGIIPDLETVSCAAVLREEGGAPTLYVAGIDDSSDTQVYWAELPIKPFDDDIDYSDTAEFISSSFTGGLQFKVKAMNYLTLESKDLSATNYCRAYYKTAFTDSWTQLTPDFTISPSQTITLPTGLYGTDIWLRFVSTNSTLNPYYFGFNVSARVTGEDSKRYIEGLLRLVDFASGINKTQRSDYTREHLTQQLEYLRTYAGNFTIYERHSGDEMVVTIEAPTPEYSEFAVKGGKFETGCYIKLLEV